MRWLLLALPLLLAPAAGAQTPLGLRVMAGASSPTIDESYVTHDPVVGLAAFTEAPLSAAASLLLEAGYAQAAIGYPDLDVPPDLGPLVYEARTRAHLVSVAPALRYRVGQAAARPYLLAGPRVDVKLHESSTVDGDQGRTAYFGPLMYGGAAGAGVAFDSLLGVGAVDLDVRGSYLFGTRFWDADPDPRKGDIGHKALELRVGFSL